MRTIIRRYAVLPESGRPWSGRVLVLAAVAGFLLGPMTSYAGSSPFFDVTVTKLRDSGRATAVSGTVILKSRLNQPTQVKLVYPKVFRGASSLIDQKRYGIETNSAVLIHPRGSRHLPFRFRLNSNGKHLALLLIETYDKSGRTLLGRQPVDLYFMVEKGRYKRSTYAELYTTKEPTMVVLKTPSQAHVIPHRSIGDLKKHGFPEIPDKKLPETRGGSIEKERKDSAGIPPVRTRLSKPDIPNVLRAPSPGQNFFTRLLGIEDAVAGAPPYTIKGRFSYKGIDYQLRPAWYWEVVLSWKKSSNEWVTLDSGRVGYTGHWQLSFAELGYQGQNLYVSYRLNNQYVSFEKDEAGTPYKWGHHFSDISNSLDIGHWYADTSPAGQYAGVADAYANSVDYFGRSLMHGIDPVRSQPIRVFIPNTWYNCGLDQEAPHSCARREGEDGAGWVWMAAKHIYTVNSILLTPTEGLSILPYVFLIDFIPQDRTIRHELSHQLHYEFWDNELPPYDQVAYFNCTSAEAKGRALVEGFAEAVTFWHLHELDEITPTEDGYVKNIESPFFDACKNEAVPAAVAGTFWDLMDTHEDDDAFDHMHFENPVDVFSIFLGGGYYETMSELEDNYIEAFGPWESDSNQLHPVECVFAGNFIHGKTTYNIVEGSTKYGMEGGCDY